MKVLIVVTHLLGTGHLVRALLLGQAFADDGHEVIIVSGGVTPTHLTPPPYRFVQLPALRSDGVNFTKLLDGQGNLAGSEVFQRRHDLLKDCLRNERPDVVITELYPFGRRMLKDEFMSLLQTAHDLSPRPLICASIRDILAPPSKPAKADVARSVLRSFYDAVLVHSDATITQLGASWPVTDDIANLLCYTGYVAPEPAVPHPLGLGKDEILVTTGGGNVGLDLFETAVRTAKETPALTWRLLLGGAQAEERIRLLLTSAPDNCIVQPAAPEFRQMLYQARASVSFCGYNTALDILQAATPAVFVPFDDGAEVEQGLRANALSQLPGIETVSTGELTPARLLAAVDRAVAAPRRPIDVVAMRGASNSVDIVKQLFAEKRK